MFKLSRMTDYGVVLLSQMAQERAVQTASHLADATALPYPTVSKVLKLLARRGLVVSHRGSSGGYVLARVPERITVGDIIAALEGPVALTACVDGVEGHCTVELSCPIRGRWDAVNAAIRTALEGVTLADLAAPKLFGAAPAMAERREPVTA